MGFPVGTTFVTVPTPSWTRCVSAVWHSSCRAAQEIVCISLASHRHHGGHIPFCLAGARAPPLFNSSHLPRASMCVSRGGSASVFVIVIFVEKIIWGFSDLSFMGGCSGCIFVCRENETVQHFSKQQQAAEELLPRRARARPSSSPPAIPRLCVIDACIGSCCWGARCACCCACIASGGKASRAFNNASIIIIGRVVVFIAFNRSGRQCKPERGRLKGHYHRFL